MKLRLTRYLPESARGRSLLGAAFVTCAIMGLAPGSALAVNVFTLDAQADGAAGVTVDSSGTGYFAWEHKASDATDETEFCKVARGGACTSPVVLDTPPLNPAPYDSTDVSAAFPVLGAGSTVYVVGPRFVAADVVVWTSTDGGQTFGPATQVTPTGAYAGTAPSDVLLAGTSFLISSDNPGLNFTATQGASTAATGADLTPSGGLTNISGSTLGLAGGGPLGGPVEAYAMVNDGRPQSVDYRSYSGAGDPNDPTNWTSPAEVAAGVLPSLAGGAKGLFLASQDAANGTYTPVRVRKYAAGVGFGAPVTLQSDTSDDNAGRIFETPDSGQVLVAWQGPRRADGGTAVRLYRSSDAGAKFTSVGDVAEGTPNYAIYPDSVRLAAADDGQGFVSFGDYGGGRQLLRVADLNPIPELTPGAVSVVRSAITAKVTVNTSGSLAATTAITNGQALAAAARHKTCTTGHVLIRSHGKSRCVSDSFATRTIKIRAAGTYVVKLAANPGARRALALGRTLHVKETLRFSPATGGKPVVTTFTVTVHARGRS
jgi:hypothetical protein